MKKKYFSTKQAANKAKKERSQNGEHGLRCQKVQDKVGNLSYALRLNI